MHFSMTINIPFFVICEVSEDIMQEKCHHFSYDMRVLPARLVLANLTTISIAHE